MNTKCKTTIRTGQLESREINISRGLSQGDYLSSFLVKLIADSIIAIFTKRENKKSKILLQSPSCAAQMTLHTMEKIHKDPYKPSPKNKPI